MSTAKIVRDEAQAAFVLDQSSSAPQFSEFTDILPQFCAKHNHPLMDGSLCLCKMICSSNEEVIMAAMLFIDSEDESEGFELGDESFIVFLPASATEDLDTAESVDEIVDTYSDQGAAKVPLSALVSAYNEVHKTKFEL